MESLDDGQRNQIDAFLKTFIGTQPISIMTTRNVDAVSGKTIDTYKPPLMYKDGDQTEYDTAEMAKTIANRGNDIFGGTTEKKPEQESDS